MSSTKVLYSQSCCSSVCAIIEIVHKISFAIKDIFRVRKIIMVIPSWFFMQCNGVGQIVNFLPLTKLDTRNGLSSPNVRKILQDKYYFMWFATQDGLNRFDGVNFVQFNSNIQSKDLTLLRSDVFDIAIDKSGNYLWVLTTYGGLNKIDIKTCKVTGTFPLNISKSENSRWYKCLSIYGDNIFIGTNEGVIIKFNISSGLITNHINIADTLKQASVIDD